MLARLDSELNALVAAAIAEGPCRVWSEQIRRSVPARMAPSFQSAVEQAAENARSACHTRLSSGAGHDAQVFAAHMPAGMMFVPSIGGISHHWTENTSNADIVLGARVFCDAVVQLLKA